jgi:glycosyltransferase involved in cell wall biosynthesis
MRRLDGLRVLQLSDFYPPALGGLERVVADLSTGLAGRGAEVTVATMTPHPQGTPGVRVLALDALTARVPGLHADPSRPFHPTAPDPLAMRRLDELVASYRPHVVHAHSWLINSWLPLRRRHPQVRTVAYAHDYGLFCPRKTNQRDDDGKPCDAPSLVRCAACARSQYGPAKAAMLAGGVTAMRPLVRRVDAVVAVSTAVSVSLAAALGTPRPEVIPPALNLTSTPSLSSDGDGTTRARARRPAFLPEGSFVLYVGQVSRHKGLEVLLDAMRRLPDLHLVILGMPKPGWSPPAQDNVTVRLDVPHAHVMAAWREACLGVVPSLWADPMPLVALEAMSQGCPLVVSAVGGLVDSVRDDVNGCHVPPGDALALAGAIGRVAGDDVLRRQMARAALDRSQLFDIDTVVDAWAELYQRLAAGRRTGALL